MRNLTTQSVTDLTGLSIQLIDPVTGENHKHTPASALAVFKEAMQMHVDPNGSDATGTGADEAPYKTVQKAVTALAQSQTAVVADGSYPETVTMSLQNTSLRGEGNEYGVLTTINALNVTTASGTSNRVASIQVSGNVTHSGGAPLYMAEMTVNGNFVSTSAAYEEIRHTRIQDGTITKTTAGVLEIVDSWIGNATFSTPGTVLSLDNVSIDPGKVLTIGAGVIYSLNDVRGMVVIDPAAIPAEQSALAQGLTGLAAKSVETATFNDVRLTNVPTITGATKVLVRDSNGVVSEELASSLGSTVAITQTVTSGTELATVTVNGVATKIYAPTDVDENTTYGTAAPTTAGTAIGSTYYVTPLGTAADAANATAAYRWDGTQWVKYPIGSGGTTTASALWTTVTTNPAATGNTGGPFYTYNSVTGDKYYVDANGVAKLVEAGTTCGTVYFNSTDPSTATIFDTANPPVTNNNALKNQDCAVYVGADGSFWSSNGTTYVTKTFSVPTERYTRTAATAGQTTYTLPSTPIGSTTFTGNRGIVHVTRNGVDISGGWSWVGAVGTYDPAYNYNCTLDLNDRLQFHWEAY